MHAHKRAQHDSNMHRCTTHHVLHSGDVFDNMARYPLLVFLVVAAVAAGSIVPTVNPVRGGANTPISIYINLGWKQHSTTFIFGGKLRQYTQIASTIS